MCHTQAYELAFWTVCEIARVIYCISPDHKKGKGGGPKAAGSAPNTPNGVYRLDTEPNAGGFANAGRGCVLRHK
jgi:hypothetical protein